MNDLSLHGSSRREFQRQASALAAVPLLGRSLPARSAGPALESPRIRFENGPHLCFAPLYAT